MKKYYTQAQFKLFIFFVYLFSIFAPSISSAQTTCATGVICNPLGSVNNFSTLVSTIMTYVVQIGGVIAVFAFIYSGFLYVKAQGNPEELKKAHTAFLNTVIGVAILLGAQLIASIVVGTIKGLQS